MGKKDEGEGYISQGGLVHRTRAGGIRGNMAFRAVKGESECVPPDVVEKAEKAEKAEREAKESE